MPVSFTWVLSSPVVLSPFSPPASLPPTVGAAVECDVDVYTQAELLEVVRRSYPADYIDSMIDKPNGGYEVFQAATKVAERVSIAVGRWVCCMYLMHAHGGAKATGTVEFYRDAATAGAITLLAGTVVRTANRKEFVTTQNAVFGALDLGPITIAIEAVTEGYAYNVRGATTSAGGELIPGDIAFIKKGRVVDNATDMNPAIDLEMRVRNIAATSGGEDKCIDAIGEDLGLPRNVGEDTEAYRLRIASTPDAVSPDAIRRGVDAVLAPYGLGGCLREVGTPLLPGLFFDAGGTTDAVQDPAHNFAYDMDFDLRPEDRFKLLLSTFDMRGFFLVGVPAIYDAQDAGLVYDGSNADTFKLQNAYDTTAVDAPNAAYDGASVLATAVYKSISDTIRDRVAGGVGYDLYIESIGCF